MSSRRKIDLKPSKYEREDNPHLSALVEEIERKHDAITAPKTILMGGYPLIVDPGVFNPEFSMMTKLLAQNIDIRSGETVLDLGTGTGFQAIMASGKAKRIVAIDRQRAAVECAQRNVRLNHLEEKVEVRQGDLFPHVRGEERFDVIIFNIPFPPWKPETPWQEANFDEGHQLLGRFLKQGRSFLNPMGRIGMTWSDIGDTDHFHGLLEAEHYSHRILVERKVKGVGQYVYELKQNTSRSWA